VSSQLCAGHELVRVGHEVMRVRRPSFKRCARPIHALCGEEDRKKLATSDQRCRSWIKPYPWQTSHRPRPQCILVLLLLVSAFFTHAQSYFQSPGNWVTSAEYQSISTTATQDEAPLDDWHLVCTVNLDIFQLHLPALARECSCYHGRLCLCSADGQNTLSYSY
jgi:hypothetical protein